MVVRPPALTGLATRTPPVQVPVARGAEPLGLLSGQRNAVLITRPQPGAEATAGRIRALGLAPVVAPVMRIRHFAPALPRQVQAALVTSGNALDGISAWDVPVFAVGYATAAKARAVGFVDVTSASGDAESLAALVVSTLHPQAGPLLLLSGARQGIALAASLRAAGFRVLRRVTYAAGPVPHFPPQATGALHHDILHAAIFLSGETASTFVRMMPASCIPHLNGILALAIGKAAADALKPLPWRQVRLARTPNLDDVLALL
jgi:uroporphyrinogen-III synthase